jgi:uncharacterized repeat protein (TIGR03803 family)
MNTSNGNLFGTTTSGGGTSCYAGYYYAAGCGTIFKLSPSGSTYTESILHKFDSRRWPYLDIFGASQLIFAGGQLYGTTENGGTNGDGEVYQVGPNSGTATTLYSFAGPPSDGELPSGPVLANSAATAFYGVTFEGGTGSGCTTTFSTGCGTMYELSYGGAARKHHP